MNSKRRRGSSFSLRGKILVLFDYLCLIICILIYLLAFLREGFWAKFDLFFLLERFTFVTKVVFKVNSKFPYFIYSYSFFMDYI